MNRNCKFGILYEKIYGEYGRTGEVFTTVISYIVQYDVYPKVKHFIDFANMCIRKSIVFGGKLYEEGDEIYKKNKYDVYEDSSNVISYIKNMCKYATLFRYAPDNEHDAAIHMCNTVIKNDLFYISGEMLVYKNNNEFNIIINIHGIPDNENFTCITLLNNIQLIIIGMPINSILYNGRSYKAIDFFDDDADYLNEKIYDIIPQVS